MNFKKPRLLESLEKYLQNKWVAFLGLVLFLAITKPFDLILGWIILIFYTLFVMHLHIKAKKLRAGTVWKFLGFLYPPILVLFLLFADSEIPKFKRILIILMGVVVALLLSLTARSIFYIYAYGSGMGDTAFGEAIYDFIPFLLFLGALFVWTKSKNWKLNLAIMILLVISYALGRVYAINAYKPLKEAYALVDGQAQTEEGLAWAKETDTTKYLEGERKYVAIFEQAANLKTDSLRWAKPYFQELYQVNKEILEYDEQLLSGQINPTQEELEKKSNELLKKREDAFSRGFPIPFWVGFFMVRQ